MTSQFEKVANWFNQGQVFAYPTEAVYGLGCNPLNEHAVNKILSLKNRPSEKGMILIASEFSQISDYVQFSSLTKTSQNKILNTWPGPVTWLLPKSSHTPAWISGNSPMVAVRISAHPVVRQLCDYLQQAIVSTSANPAHLRPAINKHELIEYFGVNLNIVEGELGQHTSPSKIFHSLTMETTRT